MTNLGLTNELDMTTDVQTDDAHLAAGASAGMDASLTPEGLDASGALDAAGAVSTEQLDAVVDGALDASGGAAPDGGVWASLDGAFEGWADAMGDLMAQIGGSLSAALGL